MDRELGPSIMLVGILSIVALAVVLWVFLLVRFIVKLLLGGDPRRDESPAVAGPIDDPDDVGMNDRDIL
jgi:hypothetical protein